MASKPLRTWQFGDTVKRFSFWEFSMALSLTFNGNTLAVVGGRQPMSFPAKSGRQGQYEPIPPGNYSIRISSIHPVTMLTDLTAKLGWDLAMYLPGTGVPMGRPGTGLLKHQEAWGDFRVPIQKAADQSSRTTRDGFFIHGGEHIGSGGCINLGNWMPGFAKMMQDEGKRTKQDLVPLFVIQMDETGSKSRRNVV